MKIINKLLEFTAVAFILYGLAMLLLYAILWAAGGRA